MGGIFKGEYTLSENERPTAYILVLCDKNIKSGSPPRQTPEPQFQISFLPLMQKAWAHAGWVQWDREAVKEKSEFPTICSLCMLYPWVIRLRKATAFDNTGDIKYFMDENGAIHVPKRPLNEILNISEGGAKNADFRKKNAV